MDEVAAGHGNADCLVHYGPACLSASEGRIPVYYVFHKLVIDVGSFELILAGAAESLRNSFLPQRHNILMLIDFAYQHAEGEASVFHTLIICYDVTFTLDLLVEQTEKILSSSGFSVRKSSPCFPSQSQSQLLNTSVLFGYESECFSDENFLTDGIFLLIGSEGPLLTNFIMAFPSCPFVTYDPHSTVLRRETIEVNRLLRKRLFLVEKLKDAK